LVLHVAVAIRVDDSGRKQVATVKDGLDVLLAVYRTVGGPPIKTCGIRFTRATD
jgi:hypothetical protein